MLSRITRFRTLSIPLYRNAVTAADVKVLREKSGAPMMDCKKALSAEGINGDIALAMDWLRAKGIARATSQTDRVSKEGLIAVNTNASGSVTLVEINSETDFLSMNKDFQDFVVSISNTISNNSTQSGVKDINDILGLKVSGENPKNLTVKDALGDVVSTIRENIIIKRAEVFFPFAKVNTNSSVVASYVHGKITSDNIPSHVQLGKTAAVVNFSLIGATPEVENLVRSEAGRKLAMHIVVAKPSYLSAENVPKDVIEKEVAIFREQSADANKKPEMMEKIIAAKVTKRLAEISLMGQSHLAEEGSPVIKKYLEGLGVASKCEVKVDSFVRWTLGQE